MAVIREIIEQHAEDAAFCWLLRRNAVKAPNYDLVDLAELDDRLDANIDGLLIAGDEAREICDEVFSFDDPGEIFTAGLLALESRDTERLDCVLEAASKDSELQKAMVSAFGWLVENQPALCLDDLLHSDDCAKRKIAIAAYAVRRRDLGGELEKAVASADLGLRARALRAVGELGRTDLAPRLRDDLMSEDAACRFYACWSAALWGDMTAVAVLKSFAGMPGFAGKAMDLVFRRLPLEAAEGLRAEFARDDQLSRLAVVGAAAMGLPKNVPWLVGLMADPKLARIAGGAMSMISGVDMESENLTAPSPAPEDFEAGPSEEPSDEDVSLDPDEDLPWPDPCLAASWWAANKGRFDPGVRYLCGLPATEENLVQILKNHRQPMRRAAALELTFLNPGRPLPETRGPGFRQIEIFHA